LEAENIVAPGALRSVRSKQKLHTEEQPETLFLSNEHKEKWIVHYVEKETSGAGKIVEDAVGADQNKQEDMKHAEISGSMMGEPKNRFSKMTVAIGDSVSDLSSSNDVVDWEDDDKK
jgi:hypothetical protein